MPAIVSAAAATVCSVLILWIWRQKKRAERRGWRLRREEFGRWIYEENRGNEWSGIPFEELEGAPGPLYVVVAPSTFTWSTFPDWAHERRGEILERVQRELIRRNYVVRSIEQRDDPNPCA